ncbi:MAG: HAD-IA family hydrolase [Frankiales bacterium]|nr:HAD-IA family hydrolase [Frankiales bacterium]
MRQAVRSWAEADGVDLDAWIATMRDWFGDQGAAEARFNPVHALERGELTVPEFDVRLAEALSRRSGRTYEPEGLLTRLFEHFEHAPDMAGLVRRAHESGLRTALLSNSWGNDYPRDGWDDMFDVVVISGEVGMRKPEARIFEHTVDLLGVAAGECVFVDDLAHNVEAAVAAGMVGVQHRSYDETRRELEVLFGRPLA